MSVLLCKVTRAGLPVAGRTLGQVKTMHYGVSEGGAMDMHALLWANRLLQRPDDALVIEITLGNFELVFFSACQIAITGGDLGAKLNGQALSPWRSYHIEPHDRLSFAYPVTGLRGYLALNAEFDLVENALFATNQEVHGRLCRAQLQRTVPREFIPNYQQPLTLDLVAGYQFSQFPKASIDGFFETDFQIRDVSNRMAYCLAGEKITHSINSLFSEGIAYGAVQIPPDGQPIVLLNDRQTMGGYPKLGCITRLSGSQLAQRMAPTTVRFRLVDLDEARQKYRQFLSFFKGQQASLEN